MDHFSIAQYFRTDVTIKAIARQQVHRAAENLAEFISHSLHCNEPDACIGIQIDQDIDITLRSEVVSNCRTKDGKFSNRMRPAKIADSSSR